MTDALLNPPARLSHGLQLALVVVVAAVLTASIGQLATLVFGLGTLALFLGGFWAFSREAWVSTALGTVAVLLGALGLLWTTLWVLLGGAAAPSGRGLLLSVAVSLAALGGVVAVVIDLVPDRVTDRDGPAMVALLAVGGLAAGLVVAIVVVRLGLASLFGTSVSSLTAAAGVAMGDAMTRNTLARLASAVLLLGLALWYATRLAALPLARRVGPALVPRMADRRRAASGDAPRASGDDTPDDTDSSPGPIAGRRGFGPAWYTGVRLGGAGLFYLGAGAFVLALTPEFQPVARTHPIVVSLGSLTPRSVALQGALLRLLGGMLVLRLGHAIAWRGRRVNWAAYERRLGYAGGALLVVTAAGLLGRPVVEAIRAVPALQLVPMGEAGPAVVATDTGIRVARSGVVTLEPRPTVFDGWFDGFVDLLGPAVFGMGLLWVVVVVSVLVLVAATMVVAGARLSRPGAGIGLLFVAIAGASVLGTPVLTAFAAGAGSLLAWELYAYGRSLDDQLDDRAATATAELVHLGGGGVTVGAAVVLTLVGLAAVRSVPSSGATWQAFAALVLSTVALVLGLLYLGLRGDGVSASPDLG